MSESKSGEILVRAAQPGIPSGHFLFRYSLPEPYQAQRISVACAHCRFAKRLEALAPEGRRAGLRNIFPTIVVSQSTGRHNHVLQGLRQDHY